MIYEEAATNSCDNARRAALDRHEDATSQRSSGTRRVGRYTRPASEITLLRVGCPGTEMFQLMFGGQLTPEQQGPLADHAATCPACHAIVEALVTQHGPAAPESRPLTVGSVIGGGVCLQHGPGGGGR